jgi:hypothetical protein
LWDGVDAMSFDARALAFTIVDGKLLILQVLGYLSSIGVIFILFTTYINKKMNITAAASSYKNIVRGEYAVSVVMGTSFWYVLCSHPPLYWIPISLFIIFTMKL